MAHPEAVTISSRQAGTISSRPARKRGRALANKAVDALLALALLPTILLGFHRVNDSSSPGFGVHEWLGLLLGGALVAHVVLHWGWIRATTQKVVKGQGKKLRFKLVLAWALAAVFAAAMVSGLMLPFLITPGDDTMFGARLVHHGSTKVLFALVLTHLWVYRKKIVAWVTGRR